jgi:glycosyltransferase involved in cell wall biosynthesis
MQVIVLGMHRSGTSGVTRVLNMAGAYFGPQGIAIDANNENPKGFWERRDFREVCDGLLHDSGFDWWRVSRFSIDAIPGEVREHGVAELRRIVSELDAHRPWVLKEPRLCLLFPLLRPLLEAPLCVHVTREPLEVAGSVHDRNGFPVQVGLALWEIYTVRALEASAGLPRMVVRYEDLIAEPDRTVGRLLEELAELGVEGLHVPSQAEIAAFLLPELHRVRASADARGLRLNAWQAELAAASEDRRCLDAWTRTEVSEGALDTLQLFEEGREREDRIVGLEAEIERETRRVQHASNALRTIETRLRSLSRSRAWRIASKGMSLRWRLTAGTAPPESPLERVLADVGEAQRSLVTLRVEGGDRRPPAERASASEAVHSSSGSETAPTRRSRPKVAVIAWDVGHNPLGRAYVLADLLRRHFDVEIWGAQFERYGYRVWAPLRHGEIPIRSFDGRPFPEHLRVMEEVAERIDADALWVSKPRLPSYALGILAKELRNRPLMLDVDDHELAFFDEDTGLDLWQLEKLPKDELSWPFERAWTRGCEPLIAAADRLTVSNVALQERFGGLVVPHARDERVFDPKRYDREASRRRLGVSESDRLLLFGGTPRIYKGIIELLRAVDRLGDDRYRIALFGTRELAELRSQIGELERWVLPLPYQRFDELAPLVGAADLACVLHDADHPVSRYQFPAKVFDALAMSVPCLVSPSPPLRPLIDEGVLQVHDGAEPLHQRIEAVFDDYEEATDRARNGRKVFLEKYSYEAVGESVVPEIEGLLRDPPRIDLDLRALVDVPRRLYGGDAGRAVQAPVMRPARAPGQRKRTVHPGEPYDLVVFWRQNDTSIYGRRQDMFLKYLERSGRFHTIVHFDNPITPEALYRLYRSASRGTDQGRLVARQTLGRLLRRGGDDGVHFHTFLYAGRRSARLGLPRRSQYVDYVSAVLRGHGVGDRPTIFWVYPRNDDFPPIADALDPDLVVADVVDDNRTWHPEGSREWDRADRNYEEVLSRSDVVLANCETVAQSMQQFTSMVHVVPNGCELPDREPPSPRPRELRNLRGPIIGYVGNLSSRIDLGLLEALARARPDWHLVLVGSAHLDPSILRLDAHPNVHFVGVKPYDETRRLVEHFDVALIPHLDNEMTRAMNPLKAFVYCAAGVPVVSTPISGLDELADLITVAEGPNGFIDAIEKHLVAGKRSPDLDVLDPHAWPRRVERALELIDEAMISVSEHETLPSEVSR